MIDVQTEKEVEKHLVNFIEYSSYCDCRQLQFTKFFCGFIST